MNIIGGILGAICLYFAVAWFHDATFTKGYLKGRNDELTWWTSREDEVDEVRKQIWRETPKKGMWL